MYVAGKCRDWLRLESSPEEVTLCQKNVQWLRQSLFGKGASLSAQSEAHATPWRPLRLIDVNPKENFDCRLVVADENVVSSHSPYLALSYCWGNSEDERTQFKTKIKTFDDRMRGFLLEEVPKCIRDAVQVSRALGVRYLWVDALCILQDDKSDWEMQSAQMAQIYGNAIAVICAAASSSCHQGFLERNKTSASIKFQSKIDSTIYGHFNISFNDNFKFGHGNFDAARLDTYYCKWAFRGWTHQELYLARHAIIFGRRKIHHRCSDMVWTENEATKRDGIKISLNKRSIQEKDDTVRSGWIDAVHYFANREFSIISDRLPAISGLAETVSGSCPDQYLAGIRRSYLHHDLIWALDATGGNLFGADERLNPPDPYIAPSWSWASRRQAIHNPSIARTLLFGPLIVQDSKKEYSKVETCISLIGQNPYGHVSHGSLTFSAIVAPLWVRLELDKPFWAEFLGNQYRIHIPRRTLRHHTGDDFSARVLLDWSPSEKGDSIDDLWFFLLGSCRNYRKPRDLSSISESEDESNHANISGRESSNDDSSDDWSTVLDEEEECVEQTTSTSVEDVDYGSQLSGSACEESENGMEPMPTRQESHRDEASSETQSEPGRKASTSNLSTAPPSSHESEERASCNGSDELFETESEPDAECSEHDRFEGRIAYGLIIHPTGKPGQFSRVGVWASHDFEFFRGRSESTFELI